MFGKLRSKYFKKDLSRNFNINNADCTLMTFDTTKVGSANTHVVLPFVATGTYNCIISWGDGTTSRITAWNDAALDHTYAATGTYDVAITGVCNGWRYNNAGDKLKLMVIKRWGKDFRLGNANGYFYGCANLTITATDILNLTGTTDLSYAFAICSSITTFPSLATLDTLNVTNMFALFWTCTNFNQSVSNLNTTNVTTMASMFESCTNFKQSVSNFNTTKVTLMTSMFYLCTNFNQSVSNFNTTKVTSMENMFWLCSTFNQDVSGFDVQLVTTMAQMFLNANALSTANYDALLISWAAQTVKPDVAFHAGDATYSAGAAATARAHLVNTHLWTILDGGQAA